jgi:hypothetical protein
MAFLITAWKLKQVGEKKLFDISCSAMDHSGTGSNILLTAQDITVQKRRKMKERTF